MLRSHNRLIHDLAEILLVNETIDAEEMEIVVQCYNNTLKDQKTADSKSNTIERITA